MVLQAKAVVKKRGCEILMPNAGHEQRPEAGATQERRL
jgi:hypothetical protein